MASAAEELNFSFNCKLSILNVSGPLWLAAGGWVSEAVLDHWCGVGGLVGFVFKTMVWPQSHTHFRCFPFFFFNKLSGRDFSQLCHYPFVVKTWTTVILSLTQQGPFAQDSGSGREPAPGRSGTAASERGRSHASRGGVIPSP